MTKNLLYLVLISLTSCSIGSNLPTVYFAGEIVNPTTDYVVLLKGETVIDSAKLDTENRFVFKFDTISEGLYHFNHAPEFQYIYLKKGDSLVVRLNTMAFDESLVFSGKGEEINNFLLNLFLKQENEKNDINKAYGLSPKAFEEVIDSLSQLKKDQLTDLIQEQLLTPNEIKLAQASIAYSYFTFKEKYPFVHRNFVKDRKIVTLPKEFYTYRENLNYNDADLAYLQPYHNFMNIHIANISYMNFKDGNLAKNPLQFNTFKLKLIDSLVNDKALRDNLFRSVAFNYLLKAQDIAENNEAFISEFNIRSINNAHKEEIDNLFEGVSNIQPNNTIPGVFVTDINGNSKSLTEIAAKGKTVFYFWTGGNANQFNNITKRITSLKSKYDNINFVGLNIKTEEENWKGLLVKAGLNTENQYHTTDFNALTKALVIYPINKCIITNNGKIVNGFSNIFTAAVENDIAKTMHQEQLAKN